MLISITGEPVQASQEAASLAEQLLQKRPDSFLLKVNDENFNMAQIRELVSSQGLFAQKYIVSLRLSEENLSLLMHELADRLQSSHNVFIVTAQIQDDKLASKLKEISYQYKHFKPRSNEASSLAKSNVFADFINPVELRRLPEINNYLTNNLSDKNALSGALFWYAKAVYLGTSRYKGAHIKNKEKFLKDLARLRSEQLFFEQGFANKVFAVLMENFDN